MAQKQISVTMPEVLFKVSKTYAQKFGYKNLQEFILDLIRRQVVLKNIERYEAIEARMQKGVGVKRFNRKDALHYIKNL